MSEKEKVLTITLMRADLYDTPNYVGACLKLPASRNEIQDAFDRARIKEGQPYKLMECLDVNGDELIFTHGNTNLAELNFLADRISKLDEYDRRAFYGCIMLYDNKPDIRTLINLTYGLTDVRVIPIDNDYELGKFFVDNDFIEAISNVPHEFQEELMDILDYEKIGKNQREAEKGIYYNGYYVMNDADVLKQIYDGIHLPEQSVLKDYIFELMVCDSTFYPSDIDECTMLRLPATQEEIAEVLKEQDIKNFDGCVVFTNKSSIPKLNGVFGEYEDIEKIKLLAERIYELRCQGQEAKYKAALELMDCTDIDQALDLTQNLDCYDFYPELSTVEDYVRKEFLERYHIPEDEPFLKFIHFYCYDHAHMQEANMCTTPYGIIRCNDREMKLEYSSPQQFGQQML